MKKFARLLDDSDLGQVLLTLGWDGDTRGVEITFDPGVPGVESQGVFMGFREDAEDLAQKFLLEATDEDILTLARSLREQTRQALSGAKGADQ